MINRCDPQVACWNDKGDIFIVKDSSSLAKIFIPRYFDHSNFSSFARQLNFYGFRKINNLHDTDGFSSNHVRFHHEYFCRDRPELLSKIKRSTLNNSNSKLVNKEIEALKATVSNLEEKIAKMSSDFEAKMREMYYMMQQQQRQCSCACNKITKEVVTHEETIQPKQVQLSAPTQHSELPPPKRVRINKHDDLAVPISEVPHLPTLKEPNFERQQSVQSTDFLVSLLKDETLDPSDDYVDIPPFSSLDPDQLLTFPERNTELPPSLKRMPEIGIIRFLSDLSASRATSLGEKEKKVVDMPPAITS